MAMKLALRLAPLLSLLMCLAGHGAPPSEAEIRQAVQRLGDPKFAERERATKLLWAAGPAAEKALREVVDNSDPEVKRRARLLLDRILYRVDPGTPPEVIALMERYRAGTPEEQSDILKQLLKSGSKTHPYLLRLLDAVDVQPRARILEQFAYDDWRILVPLMAEGQEDMVEHLLEKAAAVQIESVVPHYAAYFTVTNKLPGKIVQLVRRRREGWRSVPGHVAGRTVPAGQRSGRRPVGGRAVRAIGPDPPSADRTRPVERIADALYAEPGRRL